MGEGSPYRIVRCTQENKALQSFPLVCGLCRRRRTIFHSPALVRAGARLLHPAAQYSSLAPVNRAAAAPNYIPDPIRPDFSFWAGIFAQRPIWRRISLSVGLNLHYYSAIMSTGKQVINPPYSSPVHPLFFIVPLFLPDLRYPIHTIRQEQTTVYQPLLFPRASPGAAMAVEPQQETTHFLGSWIVGIAPDGRRCPLL